MKITKRSLKYDLWHETIYWEDGKYHCYQTKSLSDYHMLIHDRAKEYGFQAITTKYRRTSSWPLLSGEEIIVTNRNKLTNTKSV